jgi:hypothetical protein
MKYTTNFYYECPATEKESDVEVIFEVEEEAADVVEFWGFPVAIPASGELEVLEVLVDGEEWDGKPCEKTITEHLHISEWSPIRMAS